MVGLIAHEWVEPRGGSERVAAAIADAFPGSQLVVPWNNAPQRLAGHLVRETWMARSPFRDRKALSALVLPWVWRRAVPEDVAYDFVVASTHLFAHHVAPRGRSAGMPKLVYVHSPARYIWNPELDPRGASLAARAASVPLKRIDRRRAREARAIAANSEYVRRRVQDAWHRDAVVIHPPVDVERIGAVPDWAAQLPSGDAAVLAGLPDGFLLGASRFISYKRLDLVIAAGEAADLPVVLAGGGPEREALVRRAAESRVPVAFVDDPSDELLYALYQRAAAFVFPAVEDFGMMPVEAMAAGTPVIAKAEGGALETVVPGVSGSLVERFEDSGALRRAVEESLALDRDRVRASAARFSVARFQDRIRDWVAEHAGSEDTGGLPA
jgi:glycosyltransferase involved in cell wall biosynthesis